MAAGDPHPESRPLSAAGPALLALAEAAAMCTSEAAFMQLVRHHVRPLLPHGAMLAAVGQVAMNELHIQHVVSVDYPADGIAALQRRVGLGERRALASWLADREPLLLRLPDDGPRLSALERDEFERLALGRVAAHGVLDTASLAGSYFSFSRVCPTLPDHACRRWLKLLVPHLHQALATTVCMRTGSERDLPTLTTTEAALMQMIAAGLTNADIARTRCRSEATVRNQVHHLLRKLGARNRAEAVRLAMGQREARHHGSGT